MARWILFALAIAFFMCLAQARPSQEETSTANKIEDELSKMFESVKQSIENLAKDPKVQDFVKNSQDFLQKAAEKVQEEAGKLIPKTDEAPAA